MNCSYDKKKVGDNIYKYRQKIGISQETLGNELGVSVNTISKWENGNNLPDLMNLVKLTRLFHVSSDAILGLSDSERIPCLIGIDGGGTKTEFVLADVTGRVLMRKVLSGTNSNVVGLETAFETLKEGIDSCFAENTDILGIFIGAAGIANSSNGEKMTSLLKKNYDSCQVVVDSDIENVIKMSGTDEGLAVIIGTGFIIYAYNGKKRNRIGGYGYLFEGGGSGFDIGHDALQYALEVEDGLQKQSILYELVAEKLACDFDMDSPKKDVLYDKLDHMYASGNEYIASFVPLVYRAFHEGCSVAESILKRNFSKVSEYIRYGQQKYGIGKSVIIVGGLSNDREVIRHFVEPDIVENCIFPELPPVYGAVLNAVDLWDQDGTFLRDNAEFERNFTESYLEKLSE